MTRLTRALVAALAALTLVGVSAPATQAVGVSRHAQDSKPGKPTAEKKSAKAKTQAKKAKKANAGTKELAGKKKAAVNLIASRDGQLGKLGKYLADFDFDVIGDVDAMGALRSNITADRAALTTAKNQVAAAKTTADLARVTGPVGSMRVDNYKDAADLLEWADQNAWYIEDEDGAAPVLALVDRAVDRLVTVTAFSGVEALVVAEDLLDQSDVLIDELDSSTDGWDDDWDDEDLDDE